MVTKGAGKYFKNLQLLLMASNGEDAYQIGLM
jgi:hypothetical protein